VARYVKNARAKKRGRFEPLALSGVEGRPVTRRRFSRPQGGGTEGRPQTLGGLASRPAARLRDASPGWRRRPARRPDDARTR
jgi:hypothetical protein